MNTNDVLTAEARDGDQRAQLRRPGLHDRLRGLERADVGEHDRGAGQPLGGDRPNDPPRHRREGLRAGPYLYLPKLESHREAGLWNRVFERAQEDVATSEIARSQVWQWLHHGKVTPENVRRITDEEVSKLGDGYDEARALFEQIATGDEFIEFLTLPAYERLA